MNRLLLMAGALALACLSYGCTATSTTTRAEFKSVQKPGAARPSVEGTILVECRWGSSPAAK